MNDPPRVGILGAGQAGARHAFGFGRAGARIAGVADVDVGRAAAVAPEGAAAVASLEALLELDLDALVVALPHALHVAPAEAAAARGVHLLMEKPLATTLADARRIVAACHEGGAALGLGFVHRYREEVRRARAWLQGAGAPQLARETMTSIRTAAHPGWLVNASMAGGGVLMYGAIHGIDRLRWLLDSEVARVDARTRRWEPDNEGIENGGVEDGVAALLEFENGAVATLSAAAPRSEIPAGPWETEVIAERALVRLRTRAWAERIAGSARERYDATPLADAEGPHYTFARQAAAFLAAIRADRAPDPGGSDGLRTLEACLAIYRSARERRPVTTEEIRDSDERGPEPQSD